MPESTLETSRRGRHSRPRPARGRFSWRRALLPALVLLLAVAVLGVAGGLSSQLSSVTENDQAAFLPDSAESTRSLELETRFAGAQDIPALIVWERTGGLTQDDLAGVEQAVERLRGVEGVAGPASPPIPSEDGEAVQVVVPLPGDNTAFETLPGIVEDVTAAAEVEGLPTYVTGPGGQFADFAAAFEGIDGRLLFTTVGVILVILLLIYRSPVFLPVLLSAGAALVLAQAVVYLVADAGILTVDGQSQGILSVLVLGASTDYALLLISRFKEELHREDSWTVAMRAAWKGAFPPIVASGATVVLGLLCLLLSDLNSNTSLGPGRRHRHRLRRRRDDGPAAGAAHGRRPLLVLPVRPPPRRRRVLRPRRVGACRAARRPSAARGVGEHRARAQPWRRCSRRSCRRTGSPPPSSSRRRSTPSPGRRCSGGTTRRAPACR